MPGIPLVARETTNYTCYCSYSTITDSMCRRDSTTHLSAEEEIAAEESLSSYCKLLNSTTFSNAVLLEMIQMTISVPATVNDESQVQNLFPLCVILARPVSSAAAAEAHSAVYQFKRACISTSFSGVDGINRAQVKFFLPEMNKLSAEIRAGSLVILFVSFAELARDRADASSFPLNLEGHCLLGRMPMELLHLLWEKSPNLSLGERAEMLSTVDLSPCFMKTSCLEDRHISFQYPRSSAALAIIQQLHVKIASEEAAARERTRYDSFSYDDIPTTSFPRIIRLRAGNVVFNYMYYNNKLQRTEVTEDFTCPFCLVKCASFKGLRYHLCSSHDLFNFEFWVNEEYQAVNVSVRSDIWRSEIVADGVDPKLQTFVFCSKPLRRRKQPDLVQNSKHVQPLVLDSNFSTSMNALNGKINGVSDAVVCDPSSPNGAGVPSATGHLYPDSVSVQSVPGNTLAPPALLQFAKSRKLSLERSDPRNRALLQKRQFFHSHRAQPMALEQVLSDRDSEDEVDDDVADLEDRRMLDDFVDVTKDEKQMMHLWNSFVRKQRVLADGHIPWACEAFSKLHGQEFARAPMLRWCWRLFMIKLWNHGLVDARTINNCNLILEQFQNQV
ncbi:unnamed protein product [Withania somnifera]